MNTLAFGIGPIGTTELIVILVIGLLLFGKRLPEVGRSLGKGIVEFKKGLKGVEEEIERESSKPAAPLRGSPPFDCWGHRRTRQHCGAGRDAGLPGSQVERLNARRALRRPPLAVRDHSWVGTLRPLPRVKGSVETMLICTSAAIALALLASQSADLPVITVTSDDTTIDRSCILRVEPGTVLSDAAGDGVVKITASDISVSFESGSVLRGAASGSPGDAMTGLGARHRRADECADRRCRSRRVQGCDFRESRRRPCR
jgi:sec-independent protein translocase protein TatA